MGKESRCIYDSQQPQCSQYWKSEAFCGRQRMNFALDELWLLFLFFCTIACSALAFVVIGDCCWLLIDWLKPLEDLCLISLFSTWIQIHGRDLLYFSFYVCLKATRPCPFASMYVIQMFVVLRDLEDEAVWRGLGSYFAVHLSRGACSILIPALLGISKCSYHGRSLISSIDHDIHTTA